MTCTTCLTETLVSRYLPILDLIGDWVFTVETLVLYSAYTTLVDMEIHPILEENAASALWRLRIALPLTVCSVIFATAVFLYERKKYFALCKGKNYSTTVVDATIAETPRRRSEIILTGLGIFFEDFAQIFAMWFGGSLYASDSNSPPVFLVYNILVTSISILAKMFTVVNRISKNIFTRVVMSLVSLVVFWRVFIIIDYNVTYMNICYTSNHIVRSVDSEGLEMVYACDHYYGSIVVYGDEQVEKFFFSPTWDGGRNFSLFLAQKNAHLQSIDFSGMRYVSIRSTFEIADNPELTGFGRNPIASENIQLYGVDGWNLYGSMSIRDNPALNDAGFNFFMKKVYWIGFKGNLTIARNDLLENIEFERLAYVTNSSLTVVGNANLRSVVFEENLDVYNSTIAFWNNPKLNSVVLQKSLVIDHFGFELSDNPELSLVRFYTLNNGDAGKMRLVIRGARSGCVVRFQDGDVSCDFFSA